MIDFYACERHFVDHLAPLWHGLSDRGVFVVPRHLVPHARGLGIEPETALGPGGPVVVASYGDTSRARRAGRTRIAFIEHGIGQSYAGEEGLATRGSYAGGTGREGTGLFMVPNETSARRWRAAYPDADVVVTGSPRVATLPRRAPGPGPVVAVSWHFDLRLINETRSAYTEYRHVLPELARTYPTIGHGHPRLFDRVAWAYRRWGIEPVRDFADVCRRADVYVCDNSSTIFEFAATGRPVVVVNSRHYRRDVDHGLRFWEAADVGVQVDRADDLIGAITEALRDAPERKAARKAALGIVFSVQDRQVERAVEALTSWARVAVAA